MVGRPYLWMLAGSTCFAVMSALAHSLGGTCNWQTVAFFRAFLVFLFVGALCLATGTRLVFLTPARLWVRSVSGSISLVMAFYALSKLKASTVVTLSNTFPIWVAVLAWPMLRKLPSGRVWVAVVGGVAGVWLIQRPHVGEDDFAIGLALGSAVATAVAMIGLHRLKGVNPNAVVVHFSMVATVAAGSAFFLFEREEGAVRFYDPDVLGVLLAVGVMASLGQMCLTRAFTTGDPSRVSVVGLSQVVVALAIDVAFLGHRPDAVAWYGTLLILLPTAWVMLERRRTAPVPPEATATDTPELQTQP